MNPYAYTLIHRNKTILSSDDLALLRKGMEELPGSYIRYNEQGLIRYEDSAEAVKRVKSYKDTILHILEVDRELKASYKKYGFESIQGQINANLDAMTDVNYAMNLNIAVIEQHGIHNIPGGAQ